MEIYFKQLNTQNMLKKILQLIVVLLITAQGVMAQTVQIASVTDPPGDVSVQVDMLGFTSANGSVAAITLNIGFDSDLMDFTGISNTQLTGDWLANANGNTISISYTASPTGTGYDINGKAFDLLFSYKGGFAGNLVFDVASCEIANSSLGSITATYVDGSITQSAAVGTVSMTTVTDTIGNTVSMPVTMQGAGFTSVSSFTFVMQYDNSELSYAGVTGSVVTGLTANANNGVLTIEWTGTAADFSSSTHLFDIEFVYNWGNAEVDFAPGCEVDDGSLNPIAVDYTDGYINSVSSTRSLTIQNVGASTDTIATPVNVPVVAGGFTGDLVGALTLKFSYDDSKLAYTGYTAQQLTGWTVNSATSGEVTFQWSNAAGAALADGNLITLNFNYDTTGGLANVDFVGGTIIRDNNSASLPTSFTNGSVSNFGVSGQLTYDTDGIHPIGTDGSLITKVYLRNSADSTIVDSTLTDANGNYAFTSVAVGSYFLDASTNIDAKWSYDVTDAYVIYGTYATLTGLRAQAANVNMNSGGADQTDAYIVYGSVNNGGTGTNIKVSSWVAPDWIFDNVTVTVSTGSVSQDFGGICSGDANATFVPMP